MTSPRQLSRVRKYNVDDLTGCWNWTGGLTKNGYPHGYAHRRAWEAVNGPRPAGYDIHHTCKNPACVNPEHLETIDARLHDLEHFLHERGGLTLAQVMEIRELGRNRDTRAGDLARRYGVHEATIYGYWAVHSWPEFLGDPIEVEPGVCEHHECSNPVIGKRHKRYCSKRCQQRRWRKAAA